MRIKLIKDMETTNNKPTISDLCSAASIYYQTFSHISGVPYTIPQHVTDAVNKLHQVLDAISKDDVHNWLFNKDDNKDLVCRYDFINLDPIDLVKRTKEALCHVWEEIRDNGEIIEQIDSRCDEVWVLCETWASWLEQLRPVLENLRQVAYDTTPTDKEKRWLRFLLTWGISRWLLVFIYSNARLSLFGKRRLLRLALATDGIDEEKQARLHEALAQIEAQIDETARIEQATNELRAKLAGAGLGKDIIDGFLLNYPQMLPRQLRKWYNDILKNKNVTLKDFWSICIRIAHSDQDGNPSAGWGYKNIAAH